MATKKHALKIDKEVREALGKLDVDMVGVARIDALKDKRLKAAALALLPSAKSIVVMGMEIWPEFLDLTSPERKMGAANLNDLYRRHTESLGGRLTGAAYGIARASRKAGLKALPLGYGGPSVDGRYLEAVVSYKHAAEAAGLGRIGMSSLLITEKYGPRVELSLCLTEAAPEPGAFIEEHICRYCNVCVLKCPAQALSRPAPDEAYALNKFACRTYMEAAGGCSECVRACPIASPRYE